MWGKNSFTAVNSANRGSCSNDFLVHARCRSHVPGPSTTKLLNGSHITTSNHIRTSTFEMPVYEDNMGADTKCTQFQQLRQTSARRTSRDTRTSSAFNPTPPRRLFLSLRSAQINGRLCRFLAAIAWSGVRFCVQPPGRLGSTCISGRRIFFFRSLLENYCQIFDLYYSSEGLAESIMTSGMSCDGHVLVIASFCCAERIWQNEQLFCEKSSTTRMRFKGWLDFKSIYK